MIHWKTLLSLFVAVSAGFITGQVVRTPVSAAISPEILADNAFTLNNCVSQFAMDDVTKTKRGWQYWFVPKDLTGNLNLKMSYVEARQANHPPHSHSEGEIFYIVQGQAEFNLDGKTRVVSANSSLYCPPDVPHGIRNSGDTPLQYLVIKNN